MYIYAEGKRLPLLLDEAARERGRAARLRAVGIRW